MKKFVILILVLVGLGSIAAYGLNKYTDILVNENNNVLVDEESKAKPVIEIAQRHNWFQSILPAAKEAQQKTHLLPSISLSQAILESNWDTSKLSQKYHNLYGVKDSGPHAVKMSTQENIDGQNKDVVGEFAQYPSDADSVKVHAELMVNGTSDNKDLYKPVLDAKNAEDAAKALQQCGYATDPDYASKLLAIINRYNLTQYDN